MRRAGPSRCRNTGPGSALTTRVERDVHGCADPWRRRSRASSGSRLRIRMSRPQLAPHPHPGSGRRRQPPAIDQTIPATADPLLGGINRLRLPHISKRDGPEIIYCLQVQRCDRVSVNHLCIADANVYDRLGWLPFGLDKGTRFM